MRLPLAAAFACAICLYSVSARAELITLQFTGTITNIANPVSEVFSVGDGFEIYFRYDDTPGLNILADHHEEYWGSIGFYQLARSMSVGPALFREGGTIWESDHCSSCGQLPHDPPPVILADGSAWRLGFFDFSMFGPTLTPFTPQSLDAFTTATFRAHFVSVLPFQPYQGPVSMTATQVRHVPEPSTMVLVGLGAVATVFRYRRSR